MTTTNFSLDQKVIITRLAPIGVVTGIANAPVDPAIAGGPAVPGEPQTRARVQVEYPGRGGKLQREWFDAAWLQAV